jgi:deazaflavin-dependent oxidoreductase (nitroreductase family)
MTIAHIAGIPFEEWRVPNEATTAAGWSSSSQTIGGGGSPSAPRRHRNRRSPMAETPAEYNAKIIGEFRANSGRVGGMWEGTPLLLIHHTGAKSDVSRVNPVAYLPDDARFFIWGANGGAPKNPAWYQNLKTHPITRIEVGSETFDVVAEEATGDKRERLFARACERYPQLAEMARKTERVIPLMVLTPRRST